MPTMDRRTLEGLRDGLAGRAPSPTRDTITMLLEVVTGYPDIDTVLAQPVAIWDRLRDLATRLERVEADAHPPIALPMAEDIEELAQRIKRIERDYAAAFRAGTDALRLDDRIEALEHSDGTYLGAPVVHSSEGQGPLMVVPRPGVDRRTLRAELLASPYVAEVFVLLEPPFAHLADDGVVDSTIVEDTGSALDRNGWPLSRGRDVYFVEDDELKEGRVAMQGADTAVVVVGDPRTITEDDLDDAAKSPGARRRNIDTRLVPAFKIVLR